MEAIIAGATGLTGSYLLDLLLKEPAYTKVTALIRSDIQVQHPKLLKKIVNFDQPESYRDALKGDVVFCALGTTRKKAPDKAQYRKIDYQYPLDIAHSALKNGASQYHLISALGANEKSGIFYSRLKGEVERDLKKLPYKSIHIYRPSLLVGPRKEKRPGENLVAGMMKVMDMLLIGSLKKYRSISVKKVAEAMLKASLHTEKAGIFIYDSYEITRIS